MKQLVIFCSAFLLLLACQEPTPQTHSYHIEFETMGTWGMVKIITKDSLVVEKLEAGIDSLLLEVNLEFSTYIDSSTISRYNQGDSTLVLTQTFEEVAQQSATIFQETDGSFNASIKPLVDYYKVQGFGYIAKIDSSQVDSLVKCIENNACHQLDFSAIAKGYGVDVVADYLAAKDLENYMVEIGGEVVCKGVNQDSLAWRMGIEEPNEAVRQIYQIVGLNNKAMATSGNYRNFKVLESGQKIVHIINPKTGYPEISNLLSATIIADDCMSADAYATACMVMGLEKAYDFAQNHESIAAFLIYSDEEGNLQQCYTSDFEVYLVD